MSLSVIERNIVKIGEQESLEEPVVKVVDKKP